MIVLYQHHVEKAGAVVLSATEANGEFVCNSQAGHGFAGVKNDCFSAGDSFNKLPREGRDARHAAEKVQCGAFGRQQHTRRTIDVCQHCSSCHFRSIFDFRNKCNVLTQREHHLLRDLQTRHDTILLRDDAST